jgi:hypothetical protein
MQRLISALFAICDFICWALVCLGVVGTIASPLAVQTYEKMLHHQASILQIIAATLFWLSVSVGAYALLKRKVVGVIPLLVPALCALLAGAGIGGLLIAASLPVLMLAPYMVVWLAGPRTSPPASAA